MASISIASKLAHSINRPELANNVAVKNWIYFVRHLLERMQCPHEQWSFGEVTTTSNPNSDRFSATLKFTFGHTSVTAEFGVVGPSNNLRVWMAFGGERTFDASSVDLTVPDSSSRSDAIKDLINKIDEYQIVAALKAGHPNQT